MHGNTQLHGSGAVSEDVVHMYLQPKLKTAAGLRLMCRAWGRDDLAREVPDDIYDTSKVKPPRDRRFGWCIRCARKRLCDLYDAGRICNECIAELDEMAR